MIARRPELPSPCTDAVEEVAGLRARLELLEAENGTLRAKLNDPRYLLRRGLALLSSRREVTVGLVAAVTAALLVVAPGPFRLADAWGFVRPAAAADSRLVLIHRGGQQIDRDRPSVAGPSEAIIWFDRGGEPVAASPAHVLEDVLPPVESGKTEEVINESRANDQGNQGEASAAPVQRGRDQLVGRPTVGRPHARTGVHSAEGGQ